MCRRRSTINRSSENVRVEITKTEYINKHDQSNNKKRQSERYKKLSTCTHQSREMVK